MQSLLLEMSSNKIYKKIIHNNFMLVTVDVPQDVHWSNEGDSQGVQKM